MPHVQEKLTESNPDSLDTTVTNEYQIDNKAITNVQNRERVILQR